ncbi:DUF188 domain-containing protein [Neobittarella massiliensis]|uniref:YaiI/YqxD family protein n=1 Tax=Neobittarella massiliensis (ex Bilen et al. 2018) TaxID=2041842 RepID=UPI000CF6C5B3|nr:DUF188 domain-containing protein [Neobittarella massiliensis]
MQVHIDADACPVWRLAVDICHQKQVAATLYCDTAHQLYSSWAQVLTAERGADAVDFLLVGKMRPGDVVVTQDYGLAAMVLGGGGLVLDQNGRRFTGQNIDGLLQGRHLGRVARRHGKYPKGQKKRAAQQDRAFADAFCQLLDEQLAAAGEDQSGYMRGSGRAHL